MLSVDYFLNRMYYVDDPTPLDLILGYGLVLLVLEATRRAVGSRCRSTAAVFIVYALTMGQQNPLILIDQLYLTTEGIFGIPAGVAATYVILFIIFGALVERTGTGKLFMDFALALTGHQVGGPGQGRLRHQRAVRHRLRQRGRQRDDHRHLHDPADAPDRLPAGVRRRGRGGGLDRRPDHAADHGRRRLRDGRVPRRLLPARRGRGADPGACSTSSRCSCRCISRPSATGMQGLPRADLPHLGAVLKERGHLFLPLVIIIGVLLVGLQRALCRALRHRLGGADRAAAQATTRAEITLVDAWSRA